MAKYIDKAAAVAEIERKMNLCKKILLRSRTPQNEDYHQGNIDAYEVTISLLNALEVKEMDEEPTKNVRHLVLKGKWFDMIKSGKKREEYRELTPYWLFMIPYWSIFDTIVFHKGYSNETIQYKITDLNIDYGNPDLGAPLDREVFVIKFCDIKQLNHMSN